MNATFHSSVMRIAERKGGKAVFKKFLTYGLPTLDMVSEDLPAPDSWEEVEVREEEAGESAVIRQPIYKETVLQYLQDALTQRIQGLARSRDNTGQLPCVTWAEVEESGGGTKYPIQLKEFRTAFVDWMQKETTLTEGQQAALLAFTDTKRLTMADDHRKERVALHLNKFVEYLGESANEVISVINALNRALETEVEDIDF